jgi:hypothetical protein
VRLNSEVPYATGARSLVAGLLAILLLPILLAHGAGQVQINIDRPKPVKPLPNPLIVGAARDEARAAAKQMLETLDIPLDKEDCNQQTGECLLISKSVIFIKGIAAKSMLEHYCAVPAGDVQQWVRGRYVLRIQINPASAKTAQVGIYARFEGMTEGVIGSEWVPLSSKGELEDKLLRCMDARVHGGDCKDIR